ncbi:MAG: hypothetical protein N2445_02420 [Acidobacteria bacterium]|nr:hypothetical protein [Acidobacteriota bacterium]
MSHPLVEQILSGKVPDAVKKAASRGALPIPREDQIELWACLRNDSDPEVKVQCRQNLASVPFEEWQSLLKEHSFRKEFFDFVAKVLARDERLAILALRNKSISAFTVEDMAKNAPSSLIDTILDGQARLLECPGIIVALLNNPNLNSSQGRRIFDLAEQFFRNHPTIPKIIEEKLGLKIAIADAKYVPKPEQPPQTKEEKAAEAVAEFAEEPVEEIRETIEPVKPEEDEAEEVPLPKEAFKEELVQEEVKNLYQKILKMSVPKKVELALKGNKEARGILIRDSNKVVQEAVINSPKITEQEIETIAKMRNLPDELLRKIAMSNEWLRKYNVVKALASNPKTPLPIAINLIQRFTDFDLKFLMKDKNVSEALRKEAKRIYEARHTMKKMDFKKH